MKRILSTLRLAIVVLCVSYTQQTRGDDLSTIYGTWIVTGVHVPDGIEAFSDDDLQFMGKMVIVTQNLIRWDTDDAYFRTKPCKHPRFSIINNGGNSEHSVVCDNDISWGPKNVIKEITKGTLLLQWYDDVTITLNKTSP